MFTRSSKRPAIHVYFEYICWKFAGRLLDRVNALLCLIVHDTDRAFEQFAKFELDLLSGIVAFRFV